MSVETFIARRYFHSGRFFISVATWITILGVALGVATVCFVSSMHNGFEAEIRTRLLGTTSHISIFPLNEPLIQHYRSLVHRVGQIPGVVAASPFIYYKAAISSSSQGDGIVVRGIDPLAEERTATIAEAVISGSYTLDSIRTESDTLPGMLMGNSLADRLGVVVGDPVVLYSLRGEDLHNNVRPRVAKFAIAGIFETGMYEFDAQLAYIDLPAAQRLFRTDDAVTAVHLKLADIYKADKLAPLIDAALGHEYDVVPWTTLHQNLFTWIEIEKKVLFLGFTLIVLVAAFSMISTLVMLTMEKRSEIGILKTIGMTPAAVRTIFLYKGVMISTSGVLIGWLLALFAAWLQNEYRFISLPGEIYFISYLPIETHLIDFLLAGGVTLLICLLAAWFPSAQAARTSVISVLRQ